MEFNISIFNAFVNDLEEAENNIKSAYLYADNVELYDYTLMMYPYIEELKKLYIKRGRYITPSDIDFMLDDINCKLFDITCTQYEEYYHKSFEKIINSALFKLVKINRPSIKQSMCIEDLLTSAKIDFINSDSYHMYNESDFSLRPSFSNIKSENNVSAHFANFLFAQLPAFKTATTDEIIDIRKELSKYVIRFRSSLLSLSRQIDVLPDNENFEQECKAIFIRDVQPAVEEIKQSIQDNNILKNLTSNIFTTKETWKSLGAVAVAYASGNDVLSTISYAGALGLAGYSVSKSIKSVIDASKNIRKNELYFYYKTGAKLERIADKSRRSILISQPNHDKNAIYENSDNIKDEEVDLSRLLAFLNEKLKSSTSSSNDSSKQDSIFDVYNKEIQQNLDELIDQEGAVKNYLKRATFFAQKEDYAYALSDLQVAENLGGGDTVIASRASIYLETEEYEKCINDVTNLLSRHGNDIALIQLRAKAYFNSGKLEKALRDTNKCIQLAPDSVQGYINRSLIFDELNKVTPAIKDISKAITLAEDDFKNELLALRASHYIKNTDYANAIDDLTKVIEAHPIAINLYTMRYQCYYELGNLEKALDDIECILTINPSETNALLAKTVLENNHLKETDFDSLLDAAIEFNNRPHSLLFLRSQRNMKAKKWHSAIIDLSELIKHNADNTIYYDHRSICYYNLGSFEQSLEDINKVIRELPKNQTHVLRRIHIYRKMGTIDKALSDINSLMSDKDYPITYFYERATLLGEKKQYQKAIEDLSTYIEKDNTRAVCYQDRGYYYAEIGEFERAIEDFSQAIKIDPKPYYIQNRALTWMNIDNYSAAINDLELLVANETATAESYAYLAMAYTHIDNEAEAEKMINIALTMDPHCEIAYKQLGTIMLHRERYDDAIKMFTNAIEIDPKYISAYRERADAYKAIKMEEAAAKDLDIAVILESQRDS